MSYRTGRERRVLYRGRIYRRRPLGRALLAILVAAIGATALVSILEPHAPEPAAARPAIAAVPGPRAVSDAHLLPFIDPALLRGHAPARLSQSGPVAGWEAAALPPEPPPEDIPPSLPPSLPLPPLAEKPAVLTTAPLPVPRPTDLIAPKPPAPPAIAAPAGPRRSRVAAKPAEAEDNRGFFEKLFGVQHENGVQMAYAAPQDDVIDRGRGIRLTPLPATPLPSTSPPALSARTAVYDIEAKMVYLPNGERLEAHSGFGDKMDDIRFAHVRMKGVTPPHVYTLVEREALFHGQRAIRLHPVGGSGAIHGRAGLLAHPYLLGPRGDSNGCVSVKDYERFLQAYLRGEITRLVVVASGGSNAAVAKIAALDPARN